MKIFDLSPSLSFLHSSEAIADCLKSGEQLKSPRAETGLSRPPAFPGFGHRDKIMTKSEICIVIDCKTIFVPQQFNKFHVHRCQAQIEI